MTTANDLPVETLVSIFEHFSFRDLTVCRGVCHRWLSIINNESQPLRRTLFSLKPNDKGSEVLDRLHMVASDFQYMSKDRDRHSYEVWLNQYDINPRPDEDFVFHPFLVNIAGYIRHLNPYFMHRGYSTGNPKRVYVRARNRGDMRFKLDKIHPDVSDPLAWNDMFISIPPIKEFYIKSSFERGYYGGQQVRTIRLENEDGVRLKQVLEAVRGELHRVAKIVD